MRCGVWSSEPSPSPGDVENDLYGVSAISADDVWAVGYSVSSRQPERPLIEHRDTGTWTVAVTPDPGGGDAELVAVSGTSPGDVWAVGVRQGPTGPEALIEHWNGTTWSLVAAPTVGLGSSLAGVSSIAIDDAWAAGYKVSPADGRHVALLEHWDGVAWNEVPSPRVAASATSLAAITATAFDDIWAVGRRVVATPPRGRTLIEHWDGSRWNVVGGPDPGRGTNALFGVAARGGVDAWAVGRASGLTQDTPKTLTLHWDGTTWSAVKSKNLGSGLSDLFGVAEVAADDVWAAGEQDSKDSALVLVEHWDGLRWKIARARNGPNDNDFEDLAAAPSGDLWAVGYHGPENHRLTLIEHTCTAR